MSYGLVPAGTRVRIVQTLLDPGERAPNVPADTAGVPYQLRVAGELLADCNVGALARVRTAIGRELEGVLELVEPADTHSFGRPPEPLVAAARAIRKLKEELP